MILGHVALISVLFDRCHSWCWKNVLHCLHLVGVTRWISCCYHTVDCCQSVSDNEVASWREAIRHVWNSLWFIVVTILAGIYGYPLPDEIYDSLIFATDGILLPTVDPLRQLQTLTGSVLQKNFSRVKITSLHCLVIWVIALIEFVGEQAESIQIISALLPLPFHQRLFLPHWFWCYGSKKTIKSNLRLVFWLFLKFLSLCRSPIWMTPMFYRSDWGLNIVVQMQINSQIDHCYFYFAGISAACWICY